MTAGAEGVRIVPASNLVGVLLADLRPEVDGLAAAITARVRAKVGEFRDKGPGAPELWSGVHASTVANLAAGAAALADDRMLPTSAPAETAGFARLSARLGVSLGAVLQGYRIAQTMVWERWLRAIDELDAEPAAKRALLEAGSQFIFAWTDLVATHVTEEHAAERIRIQRNGEHHRLQLVYDLLDGSALDASSLGYSLDLHHVGIIAWGPGAEHAAHALARGLNRRALVVSVADQTVWAWLGGPWPLGAADARAIARFVPPARTALAAGREAAGASGFRETHRQARAACTIGERLDRPLTLYEDVALEAFALQDELQARRFVEQELCGLEGDDGRSVRLRETLRAYFASAQNASAAAARLGVSDRTIAYRLRTTEELVGRPVATRRAELETALRLHALLGVEAPPPARADTPRSSELAVRGVKSAA